MDQELIMKFENVNAQMQELNEQGKIVETQLRELNQFGDSLKAMYENDSDEMLASLGKGVFVKTDIRDKKLFVEVGSGYMVKKTPEAAMDVVKSQIGKLSEMKIQIGERVEVLNEELRKILEKAEKAREN